MPLAPLPDDIRPCAGTMASHSTRKKNRMARILWSYACCALLLGSIEMAKGFMAGGSLHGRGVAMYGPTTLPIWIRTTWECPHLDGDGRILVIRMSTSSCTSQGARTWMSIDGSSRPTVWHLMLKKKKTGSQPARHWVTHWKSVGSRAGKVTMGDMTSISIWMAPSMVLMPSTCCNGINVIRNQAE